MQSLRCLQLYCRHGSTFVTHCFPLASHSSIASLCGKVGCLLSGHEQLVDFFLHLQNQALWLYSFFDLSAVVGAHLLIGSSLVLSQDFDLLNFPFPGVSYRTQSSSSVSLHSSRKLSALPPRIIATKREITWWLSRWWFRFN